MIDRLRTLLTVLVIAHHTVITYGGGGCVRFCREVTDGSAPFSLLLILFCSVNRAFFVGLLFLLAGYLTPPSGDQAASRPGLSKPSLGA